MQNENPAPRRPEQDERPAVWQAPDFTVVDTALEVTAYALRSE
ncbi:pyrroloquinoline quinone precursor peptide PqqA [Streptomyces fructofermentans]|uniref:Coenzyme PQQ synthesis protein A n=1 Tax=Streptomyces fructofermentans TaxID=152141 RepID=A0A918KBX7_9ACTN|nr:pyrroloquinoline quinone precursor peptide PqqA [Streptomyces fructofermentans]GGX57933.1 hypothetical protein GCM10010515_27080 [Streptomyces fructofermentans]